MKPAQSRAARALINLTQSQLAEKANLGLSTIVDFEKERREVSVEAINAIQSALESSGIIFVDENGEGAGVRFRKSEK